MSKPNWYQQARLKAIETLAYWRGQVNTTDIIRLFGISRVAAMGDLHRYAQLAPGNLVYQPTDKAHVATSIFKHQVTGGSIDEWMALEPQFSEYVAKPHFNISPNIARPLIRAIDKKQGITIRYRSMEHPGGTDRVIYPHRMVYSGFRWHVRAWCRLREGFRDFNLSRISSVVDTGQTQPEAALSSLDTEWETFIDIELIANPKLEDRERTLIESEFAMKGGILSIRSRAALVEYTLQAYQVDMGNAAFTPRLIVSNVNEIEPYRWN